MIGLENALERKEIDDRDDDPSDTFSSIVVMSTPTKAQNEIEPAEVLDLADPQQMAALLEGYISEDPLTSTAETIDMINALTVDTGVADMGHTNTEANTVNKDMNKSPNKLQKDIDKSVPISTSPKQNVKTITYTLARSVANTVTSSTTQQSTSVPRASELNFGTQTLTEGTNHVIINGTLKGSTVTVVSSVIASPTGTCNYTSPNTKHTDTGTGPITASETKLLEQMDKPFRCHVCGESFKYAFTLDAHMPKHKEALPAWESRGVLVPYGAGVKSVILPKAMPIKPYGCPVCHETFRYDSCLKAHFMKSHPAEYKEKYGVDPKVIQALNVPNPRYKRPYHRKAVNKPDGSKTVKQNFENQNLKSKNLLKNEKEKLRKKIDSLIIETPRPVLPKLKKDRLRPMPPHLLAKEMEEQEAREQAEIKRIRQEKEAERIRLKEEEDIMKREQEGEMVEREDKMLNTKQEKTSPEKLSSDMPITIIELGEQQSADEPRENIAGVEAREKVENDITQSEQDVDTSVEVGKPIFIVPLFVDTVGVTVANDIQQAILTQSKDTCTDMSTQKSKSNSADVSQRQGFTERKALETTTIDLSQLKEVTTPIIEEVLDKSPLKMVCNVERNTNVQSAEELIQPTDTNEASLSTEAGCVEEKVLNVDQSVEKSPKHTKKGSSGHSSPERATLQTEEYSTCEVNSEKAIIIAASHNAQVDLHDAQRSVDNENACLTPKKSPPKSRKPKTPKVVEPAYRILTRRKYAHDEEAKFKAERKAAQQDEAESQRHNTAQQDIKDFEMERVSSDPYKDSSRRLVEPYAIEVASVSKENEAKLAESDNNMTNKINLEQNSSEREGEVTSTGTGNNELEVNDSVEVQSFLSESVVGVDTAKTSSEAEAVETSTVESQINTSVEQQTDNAQSVKSDGKSEDGLETIVIILKESEANIKNASSIEQLEVADSLESDTNKNRSIEEWMEETGDKEETRSRKGKHIKEMKNKKMAHKKDEEEGTRSLRRNTRSANERKQTGNEDQQQECPRFLRKRVPVIGEQAKSIAGDKDSERKPGSLSPQKETSSAEMERTLRRLSITSVEGDDKSSRSKSVEISKDKGVEIRLRRCSISLLDDSIPKDKSAERERNTDVRSKLRKRRLSAVCVDDNQREKSPNKGDGRKFNERKLRRRPSTEFVESRGSNLKENESIVDSRITLRKRHSANSLDDCSTSTSSSCLRRVKGKDKIEEIKGKINVQQDDESTKSDRQLRKRLSPERQKDTNNDKVPGRRLRRRSSQTYSTDSKREVSSERESKRSNSENVKAAWKLRSSRSSSWEEQAKALTKCSVKLLRCDTPAIQLETVEKEKQQEDETVAIDSSGKDTSVGQEQATIGVEPSEKEDVEKDPLLSVLEKETQLVLNHIQREKETKAAAEKQAQNEAASLEDPVERSEHTSEKDATNIASLSMISEGYEALAGHRKEHPEITLPQDSVRESQINDTLEEGNDQNQARRYPISEPGEKEKSSGETMEMRCIKEKKKSEKPKKGRSRKKPEGINIYELIRQQRDQIQTKVLGKANNDISPKEKKKSPESKKTSPESAKTSSESNKISPKSREEVGRSKKGRKGKKKSEKEMEVCINHEKQKEAVDGLNIEKEIGIIIPVKSKSCSHIVQNSPDETWKAEENIQKNKLTSSDEANALDELLELATGRTLRSEVQRSTEKYQIKSISKHGHSSSLRQDISDFEKAVHLSIMEAKHTRKEKKKKKKHKRDKRDSSPFSLPQSCDHSVKIKKKKKKKHKHKDRKDSKEDNLLDLSEEQVQLLEQSFELMMPDLFRQLTIESPPSADGDQSCNDLVGVQITSKKEKKQSPIQNKSPCNSKKNPHKVVHDGKSPTQESKSTRTDDNKKSCTQEMEKDATEEIAVRSTCKTNAQTPKSSKSKKPETPPKAKPKISEVPSVPSVVKEEKARTTRVKLTRAQAKENETHKQQNITAIPAQDLSVKPIEKKDKSDRKAIRKAEKEKASKKDKCGDNRYKIDDEHKRITDTRAKHGDKINDKDDKNISRGKYHVDKRDKYEKRRDYDRRARTENLFLQDISQTPKFFEHNIPLTNALSQVTPSAAPIAPVQFLTLTNPSRKRGLESLLDTEPPGKNQAIENDFMKKSPPPKRKRGRPPKASKLKNNTPPTPTVIISSAVTTGAHIPSVFSHSTLSSGVFGSTSSIVNTGATEPKENSAKKGKKRKRASSGRIEIRGHEIVYMEEKGDSTSENSLAGEAGGEERVIGELEIKQEVESSEAEEMCSDARAEADEGREVIMVSVATMTDSSYLMDLRRLMLEQEQMEAEAAAAAAASVEMKVESGRAGSNSTRLTVKLYRCDYCTRPFTQRSWMVLHKLREHGFSCQSQAIYMYTLARRVMHRVLIEWRRYGCETCHRRFNHKAHYFFHRSTEHRRKQYRCGVCNLKSDSYMLYQMHAVIVHKAAMIQ